MLIRKEFSRIDKYFLPFVNKSLQKIILFVTYGLHLTVTSNIGLGF